MMNKKLTVAIMGFGVLTGISLSTTAHAATNSIIINRPKTHKVVKVKVKKVRSNSNYQANVVTSKLSLNDASAKQWIANKESGGNYYAQNGQYYGRYQLNKASLNGNYSPANQDATADRYVSSRYGSWSNAKQFWLQNGWY